jgi:hypothetical protein
MARHGSRGGSTLILRFPLCTIYIDDEQQVVKTRFCDGREVVATANDGAEDVARARALGYDGDTWAMSKEHEVLHTVLGVLEGCGMSPTLWNIAHPDHRRATSEEMHQEECRVFEIQAVLNRARKTSYGH